jgi:hypothetical protein
LFGHPDFVQRHIKIESKGFCDLERALGGTPEGYFPRQVPKGDRGMDLKGTVGDGLRVKLVLPDMKGLLECLIYVSVVETGCPGYVIF